MAKIPYDPSQVNMSFRGVPIVGTAPGTFITVEYDEDTFTKQTGADGEVARARSRNRGAKVRLTLMQTSPSNDMLTAAHAEDRLLGTGSGTFNMAELNGTSLVNAPEAWVQKLPSLERGKELGQVEWTLDCAAADVHVGGLGTTLASALAGVL